MSGSPAPRYALFKGFDRGVESRIIAHIATGLAGEGIKLELLEGRGRLFQLAFLRTIARCDVLIVHSPLAFAFFYVVFARLLGKKVLGLVWDHYPVTLDGRRYDFSARRRLLDFMENRAITMCTHLLVPSEDFLEADRLARAQAIPFWLPVDPPSLARDKIGPNLLRIIFAGQVNATRGLEEAYAELDAHFAGNFALQVASPDQLPEAMSNKDNVEYLGFLGREELHDIMRQCDFGLVALSPHFDGPGLPSKTWEYLGAGLPCVFIGKGLPHYAKALTESGAGRVLTPATRGKIGAKDIKRDALEASAVIRFSGQFELDSARLAAHLLSLGGLSSDRTPV